MSKHNWQAACSLACRIEDKPPQLLGPRCSYPPSEKTLQRYQAKQQALRKRIDKAIDANIKANKPLPLHILPSAKGAFKSEWQSWQSARQRVNKPKGNDAHYYAHVTMDPRWDSFDTFITDMGPKPSPLHTIDRVSKGYGYWPFNCRWADKSEQANNRCLNGTQIELPV